MQQEYRPGPIWPGLRHPAAKWPQQRVDLLAQQLEFGCRQLHQAVADLSGLPPLGTLSPITAAAWVAVCGPCWRSTAMRRSRIG
jgi:hypothetical protein